ncbi:MAG: hypothetical protein HXX08_11195 [Chloroflexi bacterium]|uniref:Uncharacterized protein n=1 Tax=Candidatus Chlorohelix allophototropha TaxID=3003348 RepID=A0A8T7LWU1_9CHLR|nr:hypothetical protein [Chloroflexota bacterium]WJW65802.1 hypothetical protein OZ401_001581 [Chloroflexota bacterium L227-S17]
MFSCENCGKPLSWRGGYGEDTDIWVCEDGHENLLEPRHYPDVIDSQGNPTEWYYFYQERQARRIAQIEAEIAEEERLNPRPVDDEIFY